MTHDLDAWEPGSLGAWAPGSLWEPGSLGAWEPGSRGVGAWELTCVSRLQALQQAGGRALFKRWKARVNVCPIKQLSMFFFLLQIVFEVVCEVFLFPGGGKGEWKKIAQRRRLV
jgi:hypothetical protein